MIRRALNHQHLVGFDGGSRVVLALDIALHERIARRLLPVGFDVSNGLPDDLLGIGRQRRLRKTASSQGQQE